MTDTTAAERLIPRLCGTDAPRVADAIQRAQDVIQNARVSGTDLRVIRQAFDLAMHTLWQDAIQRLFSWEDRERIDVLAIRQPSITRVDAARNYIEQASFESPIKAEMLALLDALTPLEELYVEAASQTSTRRSKPQSREYPAVISPAMGHVMAASDVIARQARPAMVKQFVRLITTGIDEFLAAARVARTKGKPMRLHDHFTKASANDSIRIVAQEALNHVAGSYVRREDATAIIQLRAEQQVDDFMAAWRHRYFSKLAEIIDRKNGFRSVEIMECKLRLGCLDAVFRVCFSDSANFKVHKRAEWHYDHGGIIVADSLYFRDVMLASGARLSPSAQLMRTVFANEPLSHD